MPLLPQQMHWRATNARSHKFCLKPKLLRWSYLLFLCRFVKHRWLGHTLSIKRSECSGEGHLLTSDLSACDLTSAHFFPLCSCWHFVPLENLWPESSSWMCVGNLGLELPSEHCLWKAGPPLAWCAACVLHYQTHHGRWCVWQHDGLVALWEIWVLSGKSPAIANIRRVVYATSM